MAKASFKEQEIFVFDAQNDFYHIATMKDGNNDYALYKHKTGNKAVVESHKGATCYVMNLHGRWMLHRLDGPALESDKGCVFAIAGLTFKVDDYAGLEDIDKMHYILKYMYSHHGDLVHLYLS